MFNETKNSYVAEQTFDSGRFVDGTLGGWPDFMLTACVRNTIT
jgi:hypothetical protein